MAGTAIELELGPLIAAALSLGLVHTLLGPDHYLPFILLSKTRRWSMARTLRVTLMCGGGHVAASLLLGVAGVAAGIALGRLEALERLRGDVAAWLLFGFGLAYTAWGLRQAWRDRPHSHWHTHGDGRVHRHQHIHRGAHAHPHTAEHGGSARTRSWTAWTLFTLFVVGPCEPLVPLLMIPAASSAWLETAAIAAAFAAATLTTMALSVAGGRLGLGRLLGGGTDSEAPRLAALERYGHVATGVVLAACGVAMLAGL